MLQYLEIWVKIYALNLVKWLLKQDQITVYDAASVFKEFMFSFCL